MGLATFRGIPGGSAQPPLTSIVVVPRQEDGGFGRTDFGVRRASLEAETRIWSSSTDDRRPTVSTPDCYHRAAKDARTLADFDVQRGGITSRNTGTAWTRGDALTHRDLTNPSRRPLRSSPQDHFDSRCAALSSGTDREPFHSTTLITDDHADLKPTFPLPRVVGCLSDLRGDDLRF